MESGAATGAATDRWSDGALAELSAVLARSDYNIRQGEEHYGATEPWAAEPCHCDRPGLYVHRDHDGTEVRCWKCGACPPRSRT